MLELNKEIKIYKNENFILSNENKKYKDKLIKLKINNK